MMFKKIYFIPAFLVSLIVCIGMAEAQKINVAKADKMPRYDTYTKEKFEAESDLYQEMPYGDKYLEFSIRLPKGWSKGSEGWKALENGEKDKDADKGEVLSTGKAAAVSGGGSRILGKLRKYFGSDLVGIPSYIDISAVDLEFDLSARNWLINYVQARGLTLEALEEISDTRAEALYIIFDKDTSYVVRTAAEINGSRVVLVSYYLPEVRWNDERAVQEKVISSFNFKKPDKTKVEVTRTYSFLEMLRFDYPSTWRLLAPNINTVDTMEARLINSGINETLNGEISFHIISTEIDTTLAQEVNDIKDDIVDMGFDIGDMIEVMEDYKFNTSYLFFNRVEVYKIPPKKKARLRAHELWLAVMAEDRYYIIITLISPSREDDFFNWSRNISTFQRVIESVRP